MRLPLFLALLSVASPSFSRPIDMDESGWVDSLNGALNQVRQQSSVRDSLAPKVTPAAEPISAPCTEYGTHTEKLPNFRVPPLENTCNRDPLASAGAVKAAFDKLVARIKAEDKREPVMVQDPMGGVHYELGIGQGMTRWDQLDPVEHWGDVAVLLLKKKADGTFMTVGAKLATARANRMRGDNLDIDARRVEFDFGPDGELRAAHVFSGLRMADFRKMTWIGPTQSPNREEDLRGWWTIRSRQLLKSWSGAQ